MNEEVRVQGLQHLLRIAAEKIESNADGITKELLTRSADKLDQLAWVVDIAIKIVDATPRNGEGSVRTLIPRRLLLELAKALEGAGKNVKYLRHDV